MNNVDERGHRWKVPIQTVALGVGGSSPLSHPLSQTIANVADRSQTPGFPGVLCFQGNGNIESGLINHCQQLSLGMNSALHEHSNVAVPQGVKVGESIFRSIRDFRGLQIDP